MAEEGEREVGGRAPEPQQKSARTEKESAVPTDSTLCSGWQLRVAAGEVDGWGTVGGVDG